MIIGAVADIHGNFDALACALGRHPEVPLWICVGDLASRTGEYPEPEKPLHWIKGNNEDFDRIAEWQSGAPQPRLHLCGHHHRFSETVREGVRSVCIDRINRSCLLIDAGTMEYRKIDQ
jgi:predicted phosphodiesterase